MRVEITALKEKEAVGVEKLQDIQYKAEDLEDNIQDANDENNALMQEIKDKKRVTKTLQQKLEDEQEKLDEAMKLLKGKNLKRQQKGWWPPNWF